MSRPRFHCLLALALIVVAPLVGAPGSATVRALEIDPTPAETPRTWEGWGTSLCWWAKIFGQRDDLADLFFTTREVKLGNEALPGLGFTVARYNAGACSSAEVDGRRMVVSKTIRPFRQIDFLKLPALPPIQGT